VPSLASLAILLLVGACGRLGFRDVPPPDAAAAIDAPPPDKLTCGAPARFEIAGMPDRVAAAPTARGYQVFAIDAAGDVRGVAYEFQAGALVARGADVPVGSDATGALGATAVEGGVLVVMPYGRPDASGTAVLPLDGRLAPRAMPQRLAGWFGGPGTITTSTTGEIAMLGTLANAEVNVQLVSPLGVELTAQRPVVPKTDAATQPTIVAAGAGYVVTWSANATSPNQVRAALLDSKLTMTSLVTPISAAIDDAFLPRVAYAAARDTYLFAWTQKLAAGGDAIGLGMRDGELGDTRGAVSYTPTGARPAIASGSDDFLVVWQDTEQPSGLAAARITTDGVITPMPIAGDGDGAKAVSWDVVVRDGQPALVWVEGGGAGARLWFDPLCR
jgi:hypothetical protein